jgi:hypothetical protein
MTIAAVDHEMEEVILLLTVTATQEDAFRGETGGD